MNTSPFGSQSVARTRETKRVAGLPRRAWTEEASAELAAMLTRELKTHAGTMALRPVQAVALYEAMQCGGLFGPIRVGGGKTLLTLLLPLVLEAKNPILLLPAALIGKTWSDRKRLAEHWHLPTNVQILSCESMGLAQSAQKLEYIQPDLIVVDEAHYFKNRRAGRTRRMSRYMAARPHTRFVAVSGTVMKGSIKDFAHLLRWCLKEGAPIPETDDETQTWAEALDEKVNPLVRRQPGALLDLAPARNMPEAWLPDEGLPEARRIFQSRLLETRGVVASPRNDGVTCSLRVQFIEYESDEITQQHIANLRKTGATPDGWRCAEPVVIAMHLRQLALGFHSMWDPRPPRGWLEARRDWAGFVSEVLSDSQTLDTELQVANAVDAGRLETPTLAAWRKVRDTFVVQPKDVWHDDTAIGVCAAWMDKHKGIVWCEHTFFARRLAAVTGATYYGQEGRTDDGRSIVDVKAGQPIIASRQANATGRNLQMFSHNLITSCPTSSDILEQTIGRTHRDGQEADEVVIDILLGCREHFDAFERARSGAEATADLLGHDQKLLLADVLIPNIQNKTGPLWRKS